MKRAFTLVELLIVIAIIGALMGIVAAVFPKTNESARTANCLANMKSLASGVQSYMGGTGRYPLAGSRETVQSVLSYSKVSKVYSEWPGWISWNSQCAYSCGASSHLANGSWFTSAYVQDHEIREYAITNGALWKAVSASRTCYTCPSHVIKMPPSQKPCWSYVMNARFGWDTSEGRQATMSQDPRVKRESINRTDRTLLFAELPWSGLTGTTPDTSAGSGLKNDCILQYRNCGASESESIGFNHKSGRDIVANVVFADGHAEQIIWRPGQNLEELTEWLCTGKDIAFEGGQYKELK